MTHTVYILECADATLYTGCTNDIEKRIHQHNAAKSGAKYTRARRPVKVVFNQRFRTLSAALKQEAAIKRLSREEKLLLIRKQPE